MAVLKEPSVWLEIFMQMYMNQEKCIAQIAQRFLVDRLIKRENCGVFLLRETRPPQSPPWPFAAVFRMSRIIPENSCGGSLLGRQDLHLLSYIVARWPPPSEPAVRFLSVCFAKLELTSTQICYTRLNSVTFWVSKFLIPKVDIAFFWVLPILQSSLLIRYTIDFIKQWKVDPWLQSSLSSSRGTMF